MILGIDAGNYRVKVMGPSGVDMFNSAITDYRERNVIQQHGEDDMVWEYDSIKGFAGTLAEEEREFGGNNMMGMSKAHFDAKLRILLAIHRYRTNSNTFKIVVGQPIVKHTEEEKAEIKSMLLGEHHITVNGKQKKFHIQEVTIATEGGGAFLSSPTDGIVRIIDLGSGTVNCVTFKDKRYVNKSSFTLPYGMMTSKHGEAGASSISKGIIADTAKVWGKDDKVFVVGGAAEIILPHIQQYYRHSSLLKPTAKANNSIKVVKPTFANCIGFYNIGCALYAE